MHDHWWIRAIQIVLCGCCKIQNIYFTILIFYISFIVCSHSPASDRNGQMIISNTNWRYRIVNRKKKSKSLSTELQNRPNFHDDELKPNCHLDRAIVMGRASNSFTLSMTKDESEFGASVYVCGVCVCRNLSATRTMGVVLTICDAWMVRYGKYWLWCGWMPSPPQRKSERWRLMQFRKIWTCEEACVNDADLIMFAFIYQFMPVCEFINRFS